MEMYVNHLPKDTWNRLRMNGASITGLPAFNNIDIKNDVAGFKVRKKKSKVNIDIDPRDTVALRKAVKKGKNGTGMGPDIDRLLVANDIPVVVYDLKDKQAGPLVFSITAGEKLAELAAVEINVPAGMSLDIIEEFDTPSKAGGILGFQTRINMGEGASVRLHQVQSIADNVTFFNDIGVNQAKNADYKFVYGVVKTGTTYLGAESNLTGDKAMYNAHVGYVVKGNERLDMNMLAEHFGKKTEAHMFANGVISDKGFKIFRGTVDFNSGCSASKGEEREDVLLLDETVVNQTVPLILCDEENVEGAHGGTIGRIDDATLFYMMSRGIEEEEVYKILARARVEAVINMIPDEDIRLKWIKKLG